MNRAQRRAAKRTNQESGWKISPGHHHDITADTECGIEFGNKLTHHFAHEANAFEQAYWLGFFNLIDHMKAEHPEVFAPTLETVQ